jgi:hypothetical protein
MGFQQPPTEDLAPVLSPRRTPRLPRLAPAMTVGAGWALGVASVVAAHVLGLG